MNETTPNPAGRRRLPAPAKAALLGALAAVGSPALAAAQPAGLFAMAPASSGSTEVEATGFQTVAKPEPESKDGTLLKLTAGGLLTQGNSRTIAATVAGDFRLRRSDSQLTALTAFNYGRSAPAQGEPYRTTVENYQGRVRYDHFFAGGVAGFLSVSGRRDRFQGLDLRLNIDPGVAYYFIDEKTQQFWVELGYDLQHEIRRDEFVEASLADPALVDVEKSDTTHSARAFVGFNYALNDSVALTSGLEYLQSVEDSSDFRINADVGLTASVSQEFSIATTVGVRYDNEPLEGVEKTDVITALNLVYSLTN